MARAINQAIPPSLREAVSVVLSVPGSTASPGAVTGLAPSARTTQRLPTPRPTLWAIRRAVRWLRENWGAHMDGEDPLLFSRNRRLELLNLEFPAKYWYALTPDADLTDYGEPTMSLYTGDLNRPWFDETRLPSTCEFARALRTYPTPAGAGTEANPAPGWAGQVLSGVWRDLWFAQRRLMYSLPAIAYRPYNRAPQRPIIAVLNGSVSAAAAFRGYPSWFALSSWPYLYHATNSPPAEPDYLITRWHHDHLARLILPPELPSDWACTAQWRTLRECAHRPAFDDRDQCNRLMLRITTPPSRGVYFNRNDFVRVSHNITVQVYQAKAWNG